MAYGQTGSGKTYTMVGDDKNPGLYFTAVDNIFNTVKFGANALSGFLNSVNNPEEKFFCFSFY